MVGLLSPYGAAPASGSDVIGVFWQARSHPLLPAPRRWLPPAASGSAANKPRGQQHHNHHSALVCEEVA
ncbi:unnamed protein product [Ectocarpus sp. 12 AP-2014]